PRTVGKLGALPHQIVALIDYQADAVVSREILKAKTGTVTVFAFDAGQGLSEHTAPFDAVIHVLDGEAEITISGKAHHVRAGEIIILPANKPHALKAVCRFKMMLVMIRS
ncbi:MAG TPA: cupin domain-containing protein, partial [Syntrophales bacterium]|nr:cupin domain-containing protein [Syntrophales bacterium]